MNATIMEEARGSMESNEQKFRMHAEQTIWTVAVRAYESM